MNSLSGRGSCHRCGTVFTAITCENPECRRAVLETHGAKVACPDCGQTQGASVSCGRCQSYRSTRATGDETCPECGRVDIPAYMCWRVGHLQSPPSIAELAAAERAAVIPELTQSAQDVGAYDPPGRTFNFYDAEVRRTAASLSEAALPVLCLGLAGEAGEVCDIVKKVVGHGHVLDKEKVLLEVSDVLWYASAIAQALGSSLEEVAVKNSQKLRKRYPEGWDPKRSQQRAPDDK